MANRIVSSDAEARKVIDLGDRTTIGAWDSLLVKSVDPKFTEISFYFTVADVNTGVTVRIEASADGTNWANVSTDTEYTANGTYRLRDVGLRSLYAVRAYFVTIDAGTPTISLKAKIG